MKTKDRTEVYLKDEQVYIDRYDLATIKECIKYHNYFIDKLPEIMNKSEVQNTPEEKRRNDWLRMSNMVIHSIKLADFKNMQSTIPD